MIQLLSIENEFYDKYSNVAYLKPAIRGALKIDLRWIVCKFIDGVYND